MAASFRRLSVLLFLFLQASFPAGSFAQQPATTSPGALPLNLKEAVQLALKQNPQRLIAQLLVSESDHNSQIARSALLPQAGIASDGAIRQYNFQSVEFLPERKAAGPFQYIEAGPVFSQTLLNLPLLRGYQIGREGSREARADEQTAREIVVTAVVAPVTLPCFPPAMSPNSNSMPWDAAARVAKSELDAAEQQSSAAQQAVAIARANTRSAQARLLRSQSQVLETKARERQIPITEAVYKSALASVERAKAALQQAELNLAYTRITAPITGQITQRSVDLGQYVSPGQLLFTIVPLTQVYVTANFKETQLAKVVPGQKVRIRVDTYRQDFEGVVDSIAGATGSRQALIGLGAGLMLSLRVLIPRFGGPRTLGLGLALLILTCASIIYIWTPTTPTAILAPAILLQGFSLAPTLLGAANIATANSPLPDLNDISTTYFFVRQLGNTFGVTAATIRFDHRMTLHSSRLLDVANRVDPTLRSTLSQYGTLIHRNGGGGSNPALGALQIFQADVITQSRLLSYIDIYFGLAVLAAVGLFLLAITRIKNKFTEHHFHPW